MLKATDLRERSLDDLRELEKTLAKDVFQNRFKNFTNRLDDTSAIRKAKKDLARVKTILTQKAHAGAAAAVAAAAPAVEAKAAEVKPAKAAKAKPAAAPKKEKVAPKASVAAPEAAPSKPAAAKKPATKKTAKKSEAE